MNGMNDRLHDDYEFKYSVYVCVFIFSLNFFMGLNLVLYSIVKFNVFVYVSKFVDKAVANCTYASSVDIAINLINF